jgi:hypothetical protein
MTFITDEEIEKALDFLRDNAKPAAKAKAERVYLEEYSKVVKALVMQEHYNLPVSAQEREALADHRYGAHLKGLKEAVERDCELTFLRGAAQAKIDAWQTMSANERAMKL